MLEIADRLLARLDAGVPVVVATVVGIEGSAPRALGTSMAWDGAAVVGSIAGGCVEGAVVDVAERVLDDGRARTIELGVSDELGLVPGLLCGGLMRLHLELVGPGSPHVPALRDAVAGRAAAVGLVLAGGGSPDARVEGEVAARRALGRPGVVTVDCDGLRTEVFVDVSVPPARFVVVGAMDFASALAAAATAVGYAVTVCDPRSLFLTAERFPGVERVVRWPSQYLATTPLDERSVVCLLSHDDRFDADVLALALASPASYVGAMGSRATVARREAVLRERGVDTARLHSPIGLDLGASTPQETAVSILAEVIAVRTGAAGAPLSHRDGPIHRVTSRV